MLIAVRSNSHPNLTPLLRSDNPCYVKFDQVGQNGPEIRQLQGNQAYCSGRATETRSQGETAADRSVVSRRPDRDVTGRQGLGGADVGRHAVMVMSKHIEDDRDEAGGAKTVA